MTIQTVLGLVIIAGALLMLRIPDKYIDTTTCKSNWVVVLSVLTGACIAIDKNMLALIFIAILLSGILTNYALQFLLNIASVYNRKSDP